jgi:medium-chain acyl-[acyl-carrier-protein] hydrolase
MAATGILSEEFFVSPYEADFRNKWKPASIMKTIQIVGGKHADLLGFSFEKLASIQRAWILSRVKLRFFDLPEAGQTVQIQTAPKGIQQKIFFVRDSLITNAAGKILVGATTAWLVIDTHTWKILPAIGAGFDLPSPSGFIGLDEPLEKISIPEHIPEKIRVTATYNTLDVMNHVNNARYAEWVTDCFPYEFYQAHRLDWMQINYTNEVKPGTAVHLSAGEKMPGDGTWFVQGADSASEKRFFEAALGWSEI